MVMIDIIINVDARRYLYQKQHTIDEFYAGAAVLAHQDGQRRGPFISENGQKPIKVK